MYFGTKDGKLPSSSTKPMGSMIPSIWRSNIRDRLIAGLYFVLPETPYPEKRLSFWTQGEAEDTHHWLPCYDYPNERATTEMIVTVEKPLHVLSNGVWTETKENAATQRPITGR